LRIATLDSVTDTLDRRLRDAAVGELSRLLAPAWSDRTEVRGAGGAGALETIHDTRGPSVTRPWLVDLASWVGSPAHPRPWFELVAAALIVVVVYQVLDARRASTRPIAEAPRPVLTKLRLERPARVEPCAAYRGDYARASRTSDHECVRDLLVPWMKVSHLSRPEARALARACDVLGDKPCAERALQLATK
jgi:hypothetical protein